MSRFKPVLPGEDPKPYDRLPYGEPEPQKSLCITNNTEHPITFLRLGSTWETVNFAIEDDSTCKLCKTDGSEMAVLFPGDIININFLKSQIEP